MQKDITSATEYKIGNTTYIVLPILYSVRSEEHTSELQSR